MSGDANAEYADPKTTENYTLVRSLLPVSTFGVH